MRTQLIIPAGGMGVRLGHDKPKALVEIGGRCLLARTLDCFEPLGLLAGAIVVVPEKNRGDFEALLGAAFPDIPFILAPGGAERQDSVASGLSALDENTELVVIHDAARPFVSREAIESSCAAAEEHGAATVAIPCNDTILEADDDDFLGATPDRRRLWACQTPQTFRATVIRAAYDWARTKRMVATDDGSLVRQAGHRVKLVMGSRLNFKVTTPDDLALAELAVKGGLV